VAARLLFLDRDGTLNRSLETRPPNTPDEVALLPNVNRILSRYAGHGWQMVIVTNQGGVGGGYITLEQAQAVQDRVIECLDVPIAAAYLCPHLANADVAAYDLDCPNRKPRPGFILEALTAFDAHSHDCLFVGDSSTDRQAARAAKVPFCWADRFFEREIDRGFQLHNGEWVTVRQQPAPQPLILYLQVTKRATPIAHLALQPAKKGSVTIKLQIAEEHAEKGIEYFMIDTAKAWSVDRGFERLCINLARHHRV
jgi:histidinol-phosphate phosphatase family protein